MRGLRSALQEFFAILNLSRWGNLIFLFVLQVVAVGFVAYFSPESVTTTLRVIPALLLSTTLIAAGGYLINDYFDLGIDSINKPKRVAIISKYGKRVLIKWHIIFSVLGLLLALYAAYYKGNLKLIIIQLISVVLLFSYSFVFKQKILVGNLIIGLLSVMSILTIPIFCHHSLDLAYLIRVLPGSEVQIFRAVVSFSFLLTIIREITKDCEDIVGDIQHGCRTLPIVIGTHKTNYVIIALSVITIVLYAFYFEPLLSHNLFTLFAFILFEVLMLMLSIQIHKATQSKDYTAVSNFVKFTMAYGLLTSIILMFYV